MQLEQQQTIIGLDVGGTKTAVVEGTSCGKILQRQEAPTESDRPFQETFPRIAQVIEQLMAAAQSADRRPAALSVSIGGPLRIQEGFLLNPPHPLLGIAEKPLVGMNARVHPDLVRVPPPYLDAA